MGAKGCSWGRVYRVLCTGMLLATGAGVTEFVGVRNAANCAGTQAQIDSLNSAVNCSTNSSQTTKFYPLTGDVNLYTMSCPQLDGISPNCSDIAKNNATDAAQQAADARGNKGLVSMGIAAGAGLVGGLFTAACCMFTCCRKRKQDPLDVPLIGNQNRPR